MADAIDQMNPTDYIIALVQIPPGHDSRTILDITNPNISRFLRKFFKKVNKKPDSIFSRTLPTNDLNQTATCTLSVKDSSTPLIPFIGKCQDESWALRQFPTRRFAIHAVRPSSDTDIPEGDATEPLANPKRSYKRSKREKSPSPQLVISSDDDDDNLVEQESVIEIQPSKRRRKG